MGFFVMKWFRVVILVCLAGSGIHYLINNKSYNFSPREIRKIAELYSGQHPKESAFKISNDLRKKYHPHIIPDNEQSWQLGSQGGINYKGLVLHMSLTEFIVIIGSPLRMSGSLGTHWVNQSCSVLSGSIHAFRSGSLQLREEYGPGEFMRHMMGEGVVIESTEETWMLCYGRGFVPASVPLCFVSLIIRGGEASQVIAGGDIVSPTKSMGTLLQSMARETAYSLSETAQFYMKKVGLK